jgi:hypothetical protein
MPTPQLVQLCSDSYSAAATGPMTTWKKRLPNPAQAGNMLVFIAYWHGSGATSTTCAITDDKGNTWVTSGQQASDATNNTVLQIFWALNVAANTQVITPVLNNAQSMQGMFMEWSNVTAADTGSNAVLTTGTALPSGSFTTTGGSGDLIIWAATIDNFTTTPTVPVNLTAGSGMTLAMTDTTSLLYVQYQIQGTAGAINPSGTLGVAQQGACVIGQGFKIGSTGGAPPAGIYVNNLVVESYGNASSSQGGQINWNATSITLQFPVTGNLHIIDHQTNISSELTGVSSSPALTWNKVTGTNINANGSVENATNSAAVGMFYAHDSAPSTAMTVTLTFSGAPAVGPITGLWDVNGANATPFDKAAGITGAIAATTGTMTGPSLTPAGANELWINVNQQDGQQTNSSSHGYLITPVQSDVYQNEAIDQDQAHVAWYNPPVSSQHLDLTSSNGIEGAVNISNWIILSALFAAAPTSQPTVIPFFVGYDDGFSVQIPSGSIYFES